MRIWDLRRGDDEDNCTNPHGRGLRSLVFSAALEFNYLKAPIGFCVLFVAPALLIGLAPSIAIAYGRLLIHAPALTEGSLIVTPVVLLALAALAFWLGRPLAAVAWNNLWHLHYSLVLPMFVVLREILRAVIEGFRGRSITTEQLDRSRRVCAVIAALLFGGAGLVLASVCRTLLAPSNCRSGACSMAKNRSGWDGQRCRDSRRLDRYRKSLLDLARAFSQRRGARLDAWSANAGSADCKSGTSFRPAHCRRALWLSHGGRDRRSAWKPLASQGFAKTRRHSQRVRARPRVDNGRYHRCRDAGRMGRIYRFAARLSRVAAAALGCPWQSRRQHHRSRQSRAPRPAVERRPVAPKIAFCARARWAGRRSHACHRSRLRPLSARY